MSRSHVRFLTETMIRPRQTTVWSSIKVIVLLAGVAAALSACGSPAGGDGKSPVFLIAEGKDLWGITADVYNPTSPGGVSDDYAEITVKSEFKNPTYQTSPPDGVYADVILQEYRVTYYRVDGNPNVPEPFVIQLGSRVPAGGETDINTLLVRRDAKLKSPLKELAFGGGEGSIEISAVVDFFGEDLMGNHVSTRTVLSINFSDM